MLIEKVLNNSLVLVCDNGVEKIVMGKGLGFHGNSGETLPENLIEKVFELKTNDSLQKYERLASEIPEHYFEIAAEIVEYVHDEIGNIYSDQLFLSLTDHISYAIERVEKGVVLQNRLIWEVRAFYPTEYALGQRALDLVEQKLGVRLPEEDAGNIAFHIVNAQSDLLEMKDTMLTATMMKDILGIIQLQFPQRVERESIHYFRLVTHLQFFLQRIMEKKMLKNRDIMILNQYVRSFPDETLCMERIVQYVQMRLSAEISADEKLYLLIHIVRNVQDDVDES